MQITSKTEARRLVRGRWKAAIGVQLTVPLAELSVFSTVWWLPGERGFVAVWALLADLLIISPLKAGRAFFFETLVADNEAARWRLLFRYCRHGYGRTVLWRLLLWGERLLWIALLSPPALALFTLSERLALGAPTQRETLFSMVLFGLGLTLLVTAVLAAEIILFRRAIIPYFLSYHGGLRTARDTAARCLRGRRSTLLWLYLDYAFAMLFTPLIVPWIYASVLFQTARAATVREFLRQKPSENGAHLLQRRKKCDRIGRNIM